MEAWVPRRRAGFRFGDLGIRVSEEEEQEWGKSRLKSYGLSEYDYYVINACWRMIFLGHWACLVLWAVGCPRGLMPVLWLVQTILSSVEEGGGRRRGMRAALGAVEKEEGGEGEGGAEGMRRRRAVRRRVAAHGRWGKEETGSAERDEIGRAHV